MALVVLLRGINVGGHRGFRPSALAEQLRHLQAVNIGATGTFVIRRPVSRTQLRRDIARVLPFTAGIFVIDGRDVARLASDVRFSRRLPAGTVRFVSVLARQPRSEPTQPLRFPSTGRWLLKVLARDGRFVIGVYRRDMKVIGYLGRLDRLFGVPVTTRSWGTIAAIARILASTDGTRQWD